MRSVLNFGEESGGGIFGMSRLSCAWLGASNASFSCSPLPFECVPVFVASAGLSSTEAVFAFSGATATLVDRDAVWWASEACVAVLCDGCAEGGEVGGTHGAAAGSSAPGAGDVGAPKYGGMSCVGAS